MKKILGGLLVATSTFALTSCTQSSQEGAIKYYNKHFFGSMFKSSESFCEDIAAVEDKENGIEAGYDACVEARDAKVEEIDAYKKHKLKITDYKVAEEAEDDGSYKVTVNADLSYKTEDGDEYEGLYTFLIYVVKQGDDYRVIF